MATEDGQASYKQRAPAVEGGLRRYQTQFWHAVFSVARTRAGASRMELDLPRLQSEKTAETDRGNEAHGAKRRAKAEARLEQSRFNGNYVKEHNQVEKYRLPL